MSSMKQPAITKHPNGTASFYLRARTSDGAMWEACTTTPRPIAEIIASLEGDYLGYLRRLAGEPPAPSSPALSREQALTIVRAIYRQRNHEQRVDVVIAQFAALLHATETPAATLLREAITSALGQLRHAYLNLHDGRVSRRGIKEFADGLLAPQIRRLESATSDPARLTPDEQGTAIGSASKSSSSAPSLKGRV